MSELMRESMFFGVVLSFVSYELSMLLKRKYRVALLNPLLISIILVIFVLKVLKIDYENYSESAKYLSYFLTPATVCLAIPLYEQMSLLKKNLVAVLVGLTTGVLVSLTSVFMFAKIFGIDRELYLSLLPKSITTAIGMGVSEELGGIVTITVSVIVITGVLGNVIGEYVLKIFHIDDPIAKGLALGNASHAIGTAKAMELGEVEGAMSSLAIAVAGLLTVVLAPFFSQLI